MESTEVLHRVHVDYELKVPSTGRGYSDQYVPICRCGWKGQGVGRRQAIRAAEKHAYLARLGKL